MLTISNPKTFDWANMSLSDCCEGNAADSYFTLKLFYLIEMKIEELGMEGILSKLIMPSLTMFTEMEERGLQVSTDKLKEVGKDLMDSNINREDELYVFKQIDNTDNLSSNNDLIDILYNRKEGFGFYPPDCTAKGSPSVSAPTLKLLLSQIEEELETRG